MRAAFISGDDSVLFGMLTFKDKSYECSSNFNLEAKFLYNYRYVYFCSKFILFIAGRVYFIPDPVKLVKKFGRRDMRNWEHVEEYRVSLVDLTKTFKNSLVYSTLSDAVSERYVIPYCDYDIVFSTIATLVTRKDLFATLYSELPGMRLCVDPSRPRL